MIAWTEIETNAPGQLGAWQADAGTTTATIVQKADGFTVYAEGDYELNGYTERKTKRGAFKTGEAILAHNIPRDFKDWSKA